MNVLMDSDIELFVSEVRKNCLWRLRLWDLPTKGLYVNFDGVRVVGVFFVVNFVGESILKFCEYGIIIRR